MKNYKITRILPFVSIAGLMLTGCSNGREDRENDNEPSIEFKSYHFDAIAQMQEDVDKEVNNLCRVSGQGILPERIGNNNITVLLDSLTKLAEVIIVDKNTAQPALDNNLLLTELKADTTDACSVMANELSVDLVTPYLVVWKDFAFTYLCGAAHGMYSTTFVNYSIKEGKIITLPELFKAGYEEPLKNMIREKLEEDKVTLLVNLSEIEIPNDFRITTHSIEFIYGLYEIAPYSSGEITVEIPRYELEDLFAENVSEMLFGSVFN